MVFLELLFVSRQFIKTLQEWVMFTANIIITQTTLQTTEAGDIVVPLSKIEVFRRRGQFNYHLEWHRGKRFRKTHEVLLWIMLTITTQIHDSIVEKCYIHCWIINCDHVLFRNSNNTSDTLIKIVEFSAEWKVVWNIFKF